MSKYGYRYRVNEVSLYDYLKWVKKVVGDYESDTTKAAINNKPHVYNYNEKWEKAWVLIPEGNKIKFLYYNPFIAGGDDKGWTYRLQTPEEIKLYKRYVTAQKLMER